MGDRDSSPSERGGEVASRRGVREVGEIGDPALRFPNWADQGLGQVDATWIKESAWPPDR